MSASLLPCPFCGTAPNTGTYETESLWSHAIVPYLSVSCPECDVLMEGEVHDEVRAAWNRRTPPPAVSEVREAHKNMTWEEYVASPIKGWHEVFRDENGLVSLRYLALPLPRMGEGIRGPHEPAVLGYRAPSADAPTSGEEGKWLRSGDLVYALARQGWRKGEPVLVNRFMVRVTWDPKHATAADGEALISEIHGHLSDWCPLSSDEEPVGQEVTTPADGALEASSTLGTGGHIPLEANPWLQWNGGENPAPGKWVDVKYRNGEIDIDCRSSFVDWSHPWNAYGEPDPGYDIIAYRIIPTDAGKDPS